MKKLLLLLFGILICAGGLVAQERTITGNVISAEDDLGLPGVSVLIKGTTTGTVTDVYGQYTLKGVSPDNVLEFSFVGFEKQEIKVGNQNSISITMKPSAAELDELVVTALGIKRQKREIGYSTEKLDGEIILKSNTSNVVSALSGRSAGVQVTTPNGFEGGTTRITIRGNNNLARDNQPLIVVDGVPLANEPGLTNIGRGQDWGSAINNINQEDIENLNILKGPTASALYGSRGANGVIMITTKRGKKRNGIGVDYSYKYKMITPYRYRDVQNKYGAGGPITLSEPGFPTNAAGDTLLYPGVYSTDQLVLNQEGETTSSNEEFGYYGDAVSWGPEMNNEMVQWWDGKMRPYSAQPDNQELMFHNGSTSTHNLAFSGGGEMGTIRVSLTRMDHKPIVDNSKMNQTTINLGARLNISKKIKADISFSYFDYYRLNSPMLGEDANSFSKGNLYSWPRSWKGIEFQDYALSDGTRNDWGGNYPFQYVNRYLGWNYYNNNTTLDRDKYIGAFTLAYDITSWLNLTGRFGLDYTFDQTENRNKPADIAGLEDGFYQNQLSKDNVSNNDLLLTAYKDNLGIDGLDAKFSIGGAQFSRSLYWVRGKSGTWVNPWNYSTNNWEDPNTVTYTNEDPHYRREHRWEKQINSVYAFLNLSFKDYVFLEATGRNDWSSTLPEESNSYFYPSVSLSFIPTTAFDFNPSWFNFWKIRGAVAGTASDTDPYQLSFNYTTGSFGNSQTAYLPGTIPPLALEPQFANSYEVGTNLGFLDNRIVVDFTYYYIKSTSQILDSPIPISSGASFVRINTGELTNNGIEVILNGVILNKKNMVLETGINFSRNRNYVVNFGTTGAESLELANIWGLNGPAMVVREGDEYGTIVGYDYVYHENGQPILNEDGTHYAFTETRVPIGNASPHFIGGWTTRFSYKGFTITTLIDTKWGGDIYCGSYVIGLQTGTSPETLIERDGGGLAYTDPDGNVRNVGVILPGVYEDGTPNDKVVHYLYKYLPNAGGWGKFLSTPGIVENTWVKFREIALTYTVPQKFIQKTKVFQSLSLSIVGRDLFYIYSTLPDHINPEGTNGAGNAQGLEWASLPGTRAFTFGISAGF